MIGGRCPRQALWYQAQRSDIKRKALSADVESRPREAGYRVACFGGGGVEAFIITAQEDRGARSVLADKLEKLVA